MKLWTWRPLIVAPWIVVGGVLAAAEPTGTTAHPHAASGVRIVDMIPRTLSSETNQDSEPFLAVLPGDSSLMVASAFTPNPAGLSSPTAPLFVTKDGGKTWELITVVPSEGETADITHGFSGPARQLHAAILSLPMPSNGSTNYAHLVDDDINVLSPMVIRMPRPNSDQPYVATRPDTHPGHVYVGVNDLAAIDGRTATVDVSLDGGTTYVAHRIEFRDTDPQDGPSIRPAVSKDGQVYAAFLGWRNFDQATGIAKADVVVVRDDNQAATAPAFQALKDTDGKVGKRVATNVTIPWVNDAALGPERIGSTLSLAVDPNDSKKLYIAWGDRVGNGDIYTIHVRVSTDSGENWSADRKTVRNATAPALAVSTNGVAGLLYQKLVTVGGKKKWATILAQSHDGFSSSSATTLAKVDANLAQPSLPYNGDYECLIAVDGEFRGVFSANNKPATSAFPQGVTYQRRKSATALLDDAGSTVDPSIDPFFFSVPVAAN